MSSRYEEVKFYYDNNLWPISAIKVAVVKDWITEDEFETITGQVYSA
jgi:hypothetical protein